MAHLWVCEIPGRDLRDSSAPMWVPMPLDEAVVSVEAGSLLRSSREEHELWVLLASPTTCLNGEPLATGIRVLRDRDELRANSLRAFFSTETLPAIVSFPAADRPIFCPRCKLEIPPASPAVRCPQCKVWHHQSDDLPCFTYDRHCTLCDQPSALEAGFRWTPEGL